MRVHDSQAYRKMDPTRERISRILELREILLSIQTGFSLVNAAVVGLGVVGVFKMCYNRNIYHKTLALTANEKRYSHFTKDVLSEGNSTPQKRSLFLLTLPAAAVDGAITA